LCPVKYRDQSSMLSEVKVASSAPTANHFLFADDSLLFFQAYSENFAEIKTLPMEYCNASSQRIIIEKRPIFFSKGYRQVVS
jgi:hypothetical protein